MPTLSLNTPVTVAATGAYTEYTTAAAGLVQVKLWGAGGGGGSRTTTYVPGQGGGGAYVAFDLIVASGDIIKLEVGQRGHAPLADGVAGLGGWPDGGTSGTVSAASGFFNSGGGGSTRVYLNGTLVGVAGAGGGGGGSFSAGGGGAPNGLQGGYVNGTVLEHKGASDGNVISGTGGTQSVGGVSAARTSETTSRGTSLQGGNGWADSANNNDTAGGGGGGGYYGGGGGSPPASLPGGYLSGGGGGSSWAHSSAKNVYMRAGMGLNSGDPADTPTIGYGGVGGNSAAYYGAAGDGKDGQASLLLLATPAALAVSTRTRLTGSGASEYYTVPTTGTLYVKLWGGAGGGSAIALAPGTVQPTESGAGGGFTTVQIPVTAGQVVRFDVGRGGQGAQWTSGLSQGAMVGAGGNGGWPDGGAGGFNAYAITAGGGGSSRVWVDGVLKAVAGGGGGNGVPASDRRPGPAGGLTGFSSNTISAVGSTAYATGGTQSAGGKNQYTLTDPLLAGDYLHGGRGFPVGASQNVSSNSAGAGGGGGYYGGGAGGGGTGNGAMTGGGGGSSYIAAGLTGSTTSTTVADYNLPGATTDIHYVAGVGVGGTSKTSTTTASSGNTGGDGTIFYTLVPPLTISTDIPLTIPYTGAAVEYTVSTAGVISVKGWGAGGAGGVRPAAPTAGPGGGGAYVSFDIPVAIGDTIKFEVGGGGKVATSTAAGGLGGWPDGGQGGLVTVTDYSSSGGGGSTRVYKNGTLMGVAAGGGGGAGWTGGAGGALVGQQGGVGESKNFGSGAIAGTTVCGTGGTQSAGGIAPQRSAETIPTGTSLQGGRGWSDTGNNNNTTGGGGGGGYYGGGGGSANAAAGSQPAGGGGSSYISTAAHAPVMWAGLGQISADPSNPTVGRGGNNAAAWPGSAGADGQAFALLTATASLPTNTRTVLTGKSAPQYFTIPTNGMIAVKMWGGGGSGCNLPGTAGSGGLQGEPGGTGGYVTAEVPVTAGQLVRFDVGMGGAGTTWTSGVTNGTMVGRGGDGGWPDGGAGGFNVNVISGGGGGSSRIWIDGVLYALAAGGGGDGVGQTDRRPGAGGGLVGQDGTNTLSGYTTGRATGATQSAGGINLYFPSDPYMAGAYLRGGRGYAVGATQNANSESCGGGGGGGYYGGGAGGGGNTATAAAGGAGGSSYLKSGLKGSTDGGSQHIYPGGQDDVDYVIGSAMGGAARLSTTTPTNSQAGFDGRIIFAYAPNQTLVSNTKTMVSPTGGPQRFVAPSAGVVKVKLWGGGGSAGVYATATSGTVPGTYGGGCGGFTYAEIPVTAGQVVQIDVAKGGGPTIYTSGTNGSYVGIAAAGGWPDGGNGGMNLNLIPGGGGGSSRVWVDGVLKAVAGGGGASSGDNRNYAGGGGGLQGGPITNSVNSPNGLMAYGGTQWAGGVNLARSTDAKATGGYLRGGQGYPPGILGRTTHDASSGYGAGGGYYGGAGGGQSPNYVTGAAGGSSYLAADVVGYTQGGNYGFNSGGSTDPDYVTNVGKGSLLAGNANGAAAYDGLAYYTFTPAGTIPVNTDTALTTAGIAEYTVAASGDLVVRLWGGGGGGSTFASSTGVTGGGGGYTSATIPVTAGQVVRFDVGKGGQGGQWTSGASGAYVGRGGDGGWPDGGPGGYSLTSLSGGGGGSSRVWVDGKLVAIAGGGGGSGAGVSTALAGGGGGASGGTTTNTTGVNSFTSTGGAQITGGVNAVRPLDNLASGRSLRGGQGFPTNESQTIASNNSGGGAGGGWYGGGGGGAGSSIFTAGAGGSGFAGTSYGLTTADFYADQVAIYSTFDAAIEDDLHRITGYNLVGTGQAITTAQSKFGGKSLYFTGAGHINANLPTTIGTGDYTFEGWFKNETLPSGALAQCLFILGEGAAGGVGIFENGNGLLYLRHNNTGANDVTANWTADTNWNHWAVSRQNGTTRVFKNGVLLITYAPVFNLTAQFLQIGSYDSSGNSRFNGWIDDVRITLGVARYTAAFTPPAAAFMTRTAGNTPTTSVTASGTSAGVPGSTVAAGYISGKGVGAASRSTAGSATDGGDGLVVFNMAGAGDINISGTLPTVTVTPPAGSATETTPLPTPGQFVANGYIGATKAYQANAPTLLHVEMWGAGGGGVSANNRGGGGGGYTTYDLSLQTGDVVTVQAPSGGGGGTGAASPAGAGGYPDGGAGFLPAFTQTQGGGGGSARLYVNGVLVAVAGGGGGGSFGSAGSDFQGGAGGGASGVSGGVTGGGTQSAGGAAAGNGIAGAFLQGGNGGVTSGLANNGAGGGGGYYGGGGGSNGGSGAGGGSGYFNTTATGYVAGTTTAGSGNQPAGTSSIYYSAGTGVGSTGGGLAGGSGRIVLYNNTPTPGNAAGVAGGTVVVNPPVGGVDSPPLGAISIGTVNVVPPEGQTGIGGNASGTLPTIPITVPVTQAQAQVVVTVPINDTTSLIITPPQVEPFSLDANIDAPLHTVNVVAPNAIGVVPQSPVSPAEGDIGTIVVSAPIGEGSIGQETVVPIDVTITVTAPTADGLGDGTNSTLKTGKFNDIRLTAPGANALVTGQPDGSVSLSLGLPTIPITPPEADFVLIDFLVDALPSPIVFTITPPEADGTGAASIVPEPYKDNGNPQNWYYGKVTISPPAAFNEASVDLITFQELPIIVGGLAADVDLSVELNVSMPAPIIINGGDGEPSVDVSPPIDSVIYLTPPDATAEGGIAVILDEPMPGPIYVIAPEGAVPNMGEGDIGTILVLQPEAVAQVPISQDNILPVIEVDGPEGTAEGGIGIDISGTLPTISVFAPQAGNVSGAAVSIPLLTLFVTPPASTVQAGVAISAAPSVVNIEAPQGRGEVPGAASGALPVITIVTPEGIGYEFADAAASGDIGTITVTPPASDVTGEVAQSSALPTVVVTPVFGHGEVPADVSEDLPVITIEPVEGVGTTDTINAEGDLPTIIVTQVDGAATGQGTGNVSLPPIVVTGPEMTFEAGVDLTTPIDLTIQLVAPQGLGYPVIPATASGDLPTILVTATDGTATGSVLIHQPIGTISVTPPAADLSAGVDLITFQELPIIIGAPVGEFYREASIVLGLPTIYVYTPNATVQGDDSTAAASGALPVIYIESPDGYAEVPVVDGTARIRFRRSLDAAAIPASLEEREIAFNEADGIMYSRDGTGALRPTPWRTLTKDRIPAAVGSNGQVLRADGSWGAPAPVYTAPVQTLPAAGARVPLTEAVVGQATLTPPAGVLLYSPFFVPRTMVISALSVDVVSADSGTALAGICEWSLNRSPGATLVQGTVATTATGVRTVSATAITLEPGWYAAMFRYLGAGAPTFRTTIGPNQIAADFTTIQGAPAYVSAAL